MSPRRPARRGLGRGRRYGVCALSIGGSVANNTIADTVFAYSDASTIDSAGNVSITAVATPTASAFSLAASVSASFSLTGVAFAGGGASSTNTITNDVESYLTGGSPTSQSNVTAADQVSVTASENGSINATVGGRRTSRSLLRCVRRRLVVVEPDQQHHRGRR